MSSTALGAEKAIIFISNAHEKFYYGKLKEVRYQDVCHKALVDCLGISDDVRKNGNSMYDFKSGSVKTECLQKGWQSSGSGKVVRLAFYLCCNSTLGVYDYDDAIGSGVTNLTLDDGVDCSNIRDLTSFVEGCSELRSIDFGNNRFSVEAVTRAFKGCTSLSTLDLQKIQVEGDATEAFADSGLLSVYVSQNWRASGERLYKGAPLDNITIN